MKPTKNAPNPEKFLSEMKELIPMLAKNGHIPKDNKPKLTDMNGNRVDLPKPNREQARKEGFKNSNGAKHATAKEQNRRLSIISERIDYEISLIAPKIYQFIRWTSWLWLLKALGYSWNVRGAVENVEGVPNIECTLLNIYRFGKPKKVVRMVWEDINKKRKVRV